MGTIVNLFFKVSGLGWIWDRLDGYKTIIAGSSALLHALAGLILFVAGLIDQLQPILAAHDLNGLLHFAQGLQSFGSDPNVTAFSDAFRSFYAGLGTIGLGHKLVKLNTPGIPQPQSPQAAE